jgi:hypothetical protein
MAPKVTGHQTDRILPVVIHEKMRFIPTVMATLATHKGCSSKLHSYRRWGGSKVSEVHFDTVLTHVKRALHGHFMKNV